MGTTEGTRWRQVQRMLERTEAVERGGWGVTANVAGHASTSRSPLHTGFTRWLRRASVVLVASGLGACSFAPQHARPPLPTPLAYDPSTGANAGIRPVDIGWRDFFPDPRRGALIEAALAHNRDLAISVARIDVARGQ